MSEPLLLEKLFHVSSAMLRGLNIWSILLRLALSVLCAGIIGIERGRKGRPAGLRTHILVCLGAALAMMTDQYIFLQYGVGDPARLGAQVISGIGFLGAGTIIVTGHQQVRGLTTAAGLWASACMGLAIGIGFYEAAILACFAILGVSSLLHHFDGYMLSRSKVIDVYIEFDNMSAVQGFLNRIKERGLRAHSMDFTQDRMGGTGIGMLVTLQAKAPCLHSAVIDYISQIEGVKFVEQI